MRRPAMPRPALPPRRLLAGALLTLAVLAPLGLWLRDAPFVQVDHVEVTGISGPQAPQVRRAIEDAARGMSTLHVRAGVLRDAVRGYPVVKSLDVRRELPDTLVVRIRENVPVAALANGNQRVAVAADGTILQSSSPADLPLVPVQSTPGGKRLAERDSLRMVALLGAAPVQLRGHVARVTVGEQGLTAQLVRGPEVYFGDAGRLAAKWMATARVLADPSSKGATYLDVRVPERPAAGGLEPVNPQPEMQTSP
jgi:cell division protein FtsQ